MSSNPSNRRAFEHILHRPQHHARKLFYERLMQVAIRHNYYNGSQDACPDFTCRPTAASAALMKDLGLLFRAEAAGFSVLYDTNGDRKADLLAYLRRQSWTWLTFTLALTNPYFVSFTDMPIDSQPSMENLYYSNQKAEGTADAAVLDPGKCLPVIPTQVPVAVTDQVRKVQVLDISGEPVLCKCKPRCAGCAEIFLDFAGLPEDKYAIQKIVDRGPVTPHEVIYTQAYPVPFALIDLLFAAPAPESGGIYPVVDLSSQARIVPVHYVLRFERRSIQWRYYIVPPAAAEFADLRIVQIAGTPEISFCGPCPVHLANGAPASLFVSEESIPLEEQSKHWFRLLGRHALEARVRTVMDHLPVASCRRVLPLDRKPCERGAQACSDIYVYV